MNYFPIKQITASKSSKNSLHRFVFLVKITSSRKNYPCFSELCCSDPALHKSSDVI